MHIIEAGLSCCKMTMKVFLVGSEVLNVVVVGTNSLQLIDCVVCSCSAFVYLHCFLHAVPVLTN